jgi:radical SAM superfamily enzyme YgiQ (UPF0313 family)
LRGKFPSLIMHYDVILFTGIFGQYEKPFGAFKCAHELRCAGYRVLVVSNMHYLTIDDFLFVLDHAVGPNTLFVGFSNTFLDWSKKQKHGEQADFAKIDKFMPNGHDIEKVFVEHLKKLNPNCRLSVGGTSTHFDFNNPLVDFAMMGYSDLAIVNLANHLRHGEELKNARRNLHRITVIDGGAADGFDFANSSMIWTDDDIVTWGERMPIEISRGCVFKCKFCNLRFTGRKSLDYVKSFENIRNELFENYKKYGITNYRMLDDTFNDNVGKLDIMRDIVKSLPFKPHFWAYTRLDLLCKHPDTVDKLMDIGVRSMFFGIETLHHATGKIVGKGYNPNDQVDMIRHMKKTYGNRVNLIGGFIAGLPGEPKTSVQDTMDRLLSKDIPLDQVAFKPLFIKKKQFAVWESSFGLDMTKYGYREMTDDDIANLEETERKNIDHTLVVWQNDHMNYLEAMSMVSDFYQRADETERFIRPVPTGSHHQLDRYKRKLRQHLLSNKS